MAKAELEIIVKLKDMAKGALKDLNTGLTGLGTGAAVAAGAGVAAVTAGLMNIGDQASNARTVLQGLNDVDLTAVLDDAQLLARRYGQDVNATVAATRTLMEDFGLTSEEANDLIVSGFNRGLDASGDFLDSIGEYSNLFVDGGATAEEFFSLLESGLAGGVLGTDKAADAFKEFGIRIRELPNKTLKIFDEGEMKEVNLFEQRLKTLGFTSLDFNRIVYGMQAGTYSVADAMKELLPALNDLDNETLRNTIGVEFFGTQWEDLGPQIMSQLTLTGTSMEELGETAEAERGVILGSLGEVPALIFDKFSLALLPLSDLLLGVANSIMAAEDPLAQLFEEVFKLVPGLEQFAGQGTAIVAAMKPFIKIVQDNLIPIIAGLVAVIGVALVAALGSVIAPIAGVIATTGAFVAALFAVVAAGAKVYKTITTQYPGMAIQIKDAFETAKAFVMTAMQVIARVVQTITAAVVGWWQENGDRIIAQVQTTFNTAVAVVRSVMMQIQQTVATITQVIAEFWATYGDEIIATVNDLATQLGALWNDIYQLINAAMIGIGKVINNILKEIQKYWRNNGQQIQDFAIGVFRYISQQISAFMTVIRGVVQTITALIRGDWQGLQNGLKLIVDGIYNGIVTTFSAIWGVIGPPLTTIKNGIINAFNDAWNGITGYLANIKNGIVNAINDAWNGIIGYLANIKTGIVNAISDAWNGITGYLANIKNGIVNTINDAWNGITGYLANIKTGIVNAISDAWNGITSNLSNIKNRIISTINDAWNGITGYLANIKDRIISTISGAWNGITTTLTTIKNGIVNAITGAFDNIGPALGNIRTAVVNAIVGIRDWLSTFSLGQVALNLIDTLVGGMIRAITGAVSRIKDAITELIRSAFHTLPQGVKDALAAIGIRIPRSAAITRSISMPAPAPAAPPPTTSRSASVTAGSSPSIVINIGSVRDARDIDAIKRAVRDGMDEAARRGIVQSQLPRGI
jgi:phage-related protein